MNPNHYLAMTVRYLLTHRPQWLTTAAVGKTLVSSGLIDQVVHGFGRTLREVPVGFKCSLRACSTARVVSAARGARGPVFSAGTVWTTDKDGPLLGWLSAGITARTGKDPGERYGELANQFGTPYYIRIDAPETPDQETRLGKLSPENVPVTKLPGEPAKLTPAPGNDAVIGGLKVVRRTAGSRPSGTENIYKLYAESLKNESHLDAIVNEVQDIIRQALASVR